MACASFRHPFAEPSVFRDLLEAAKEIEGITKLRRSVQVLARRGKAFRLEDPAELAAVQELIKVVRKQAKLPFLAEALADALKDVDRLRRMGITNTAELGEALGEYMSCCRGKIEVETESPLEQKKRALRFAKIPGYFPTPRSLAEQLVRHANIEPGMRVLEPSAGTGGIAAVIRELHPKAVIEVIERQVTMREILKAEGFELVGDDFTKFEPKVLYDRILMNPPFEKRQDAKHIARALGILKPGGRLVAIAAGGFEQREDAETKALRETIGELGGRVTQLPAGSFRESGTSVATVMIVVDAEPAKAAVRPEVKAKSVVKTKSVAKPKPVTKAKSMTKAKPKPVTEPEANAKPAGAKPKKSELADRWLEHVKSHDETRAGWLANLPNTSCWVRKEGEVSVTLCTAIQRRAIADCPPADQKASTRQLMLCQVDEEIEFFPKGEVGILAAKAEARNRVVRGRVKKAPAVLPLKMPAVDDFEAQERYLDALVPSRIVYTARDPWRPIKVRLGAPHILDGEQTSISIFNWRDPIPKGAKLELRVDARRNDSLAEFITKLEAKELIVYRGMVAAETITEVAKLIESHIQYKLSQEGFGFHNIQHGHFGGRTMYWLRTPDGSKVYGPVTATGKPVTAERVLAAFAKARSKTLPLPTKLPTGWMYADAVVTTSLLGGRLAWAAWQPSTESFVTWGEGEAGWSKARKLPRRAKWTEDRGFPDLVHALSFTLLSNLKKVPKDVRFRVAGAWLGHVFPSDHGQRVQFDAPKGGAVDLEELQRWQAEYLVLTQEQPESSVLEEWRKRGAKRVKWARAWLKAETKAQNKAVKAMSKKKTASKTPQKKKKSAKKVPATKKASAKGRGFRFSAKRRQAMKIAANAWLDKPGSSTSFVGAAELRTARELVEAGYLEQTGESRLAGKKELSVRLTEKGRAWVLDVGGDFKDVERAKLMDAGPKSAAKATPKPDKRAASSEAKAKKPAKKKPAKKKPAKKKPAKKKPAKKKPVVAKAPKIAEAEEKGTEKKAQAQPAKAKRQIRFERHDVVRFRKRSQIAVGLGLSDGLEFTVEMMGTHEGQPSVVLQVGEGRHSAFIRVPPGHLALVRAADEVPKEIKACTAKLARYKGPLSSTTRRLLAELARSA